MKYIFLFFVYLLTQVNCLLPNKMPNGQPRKYFPNVKNRKNDIKYIDSEMTSFIAKHWINNIVVSPRINKEDKHILKRLSRLNVFLQHCNTPNILFMVWSPSGVYNEVLFIIVARTKMKRNKKHLCVNLLIQSPFWDSQQVESKELKLALEHLCECSNMELDLSFVYNWDFRYKLEWNDSF